MIERRPLGRTGVQVSALCLGAMNFGGPADDETSEKLLLTALDAGINFVDTADVYTGGESERIVGEVLARTGRRDEVVLATKVGVPSGPDRNDRGASRRHIMRSCETSLRRLRTDHIDLYQLHRPSFEIDPEETLRGIRRPRACRQGREHRMLDPPCVVRGRVPGGERAARLGALRQRAAAVQPARSQGRERARTVGLAARARAAAVVAARGRHPGRPVQVGGQAAEGLTSGADGGTPSARHRRGDRGGEHRRPARRRAWT